MNICFFEKKGDLSRAVAVERVIPTVYFGKFAWLFYPPGAP
jgi:hypothetical protein